MKKEDKKRSKFTALYNIVIGIQEAYNNSNSTEKSFYETVVGAAVFYLPSDRQKLFSGMISVNAATIAPSQRCAEHMYPRKVSAEKLLKIDWSTYASPVDALIDLYYTELGRYHYVTKKENTALRAFQKSNVFESWEKAYQSAGIVLAKI
jgi:hypothetical protein